MKFMEILGKFWYMVKHPKLSYIAYKENKSKLFKDDGKFEILSDFENNDDYVDYLDDDDYIDDYTDDLEETDKKESKKKFFKNPFKGIIKNRNKLFSDNNVYDEFFDISINQKDQRKIKEEINSVDFNNVNILDYISLYLSDIDISNEELLGLQKEIEELLDNSNKEKEFRKKLKEIKDVTGNEKYNRLYHVINEINDIYDSSSENVEITEPEKEKSESERINELLDMVFDYLSDVRLDNDTSMRLYDNIVLIVEKSKENELKKFIINHSNIDNELKYGLLINKMFDIIDSKLEDDDTKDKKESGNNVADLLKSLQAAEEIASQSLGSCDDEIERIKANLKSNDIDEEIEDLKNTNVKFKITINDEITDSNIIEISSIPVTEKTKTDRNTKSNNNEIINSDIIMVNSPVKSKNTEVKENKTKDEYYTDYKLGNISVKELVEACNKIDEENQKAYDKKCEKDYKLYQERMQEITMLNDRVIQLKSKIDKLGAGEIGSNYNEILEKRGKLLSELKELENAISALTTRIVVLEKRGYAREYELKLQKENDNYIKCWENLLFEQERNQILKEQSNCEMLETFTDEELDSMKENGFTNESDIEAVMKFKKMMKM